MTADEAAPVVGRRIDLGNGEWVVMRSMTIDDLEAISDVDKNFAGAIRAVKDACLEAHFANGEPVGKQRSDRVVDIVKGWNRAEDEVAIPPENGQPSASPF